MSDTEPKTDDDAPLWRDLRQELSRPAYGLPFQDPPLEPEPTPPPPDAYAGETIYSRHDASEDRDDDQFVGYRDKDGNWLGYLRVHRGEE